MLKSLAALILSLSFLASPQSSSIFKAVHSKQWGTAFCAPGKTSVLITAGHAVDSTMVIYDQFGTNLGEVNVLVKDTVKDLGVVMLKEGSPCSMSTLEFAPKDASPGDNVTIEGYGGGFPVRVYLHGSIASEPFTKDGQTVQLLQSNALFGHSGSPVLNSAGKIVGILIGVWNATLTADEIDVIVPVSAVKKVLK